MPATRILRCRWTLVAVAVGLVAACCCACNPQHANSAPRPPSSQSAAVNAAPRAGGSASAAAPTTVAPTPSATPEPGPAPLPLVPPPTTAPSDALAQAPAESSDQPPAKGPDERAANAQSPLGTNLDAINDWSPDFVFVDAMKRSRDWISSPKETWDDQRPFSLDERGWVRELKPGQRARSLIFWGQPHYPGGEYVVLYDGAGTLSYDIQGKVLYRKPGRDTVLVDSKANFGLLIEAIPSPQNYIKNIRVIMPGGVCINDPVRYCDFKHPCAGSKACVSFEQNHQTQVFHPKFLERIQRFSALRFMDWMKTNESTQEKWKDRPLPTDVRFREGAPLETMVALANRLSQHPWFNIPHAADDDYVRRFATYVRDNLRPDLKAYVEYSNEVWNGQFPQANYATEMGKKQGLGESNWDAQYRFYSKRTTEIHKIWESVFKGQQKRVVRVMGTQVANAGVAHAVLDYRDAKEHVDALAVAPYFGGEYGSREEAPRWENANVSEVIEDLRKRSLPASFAMIKTAAETAAKYKIDLVAYEGGESFAAAPGVENNEKLNKLFDAVGRDPRMKDIYVEYLAGWKKNGGKLFMHFTDCFSPSKWGRWGALEWLEQPRKDAPKFDGLMTFIEKTPRWW